MVKNKSLPVSGLAGRGNLCLGIREHLWVMAEDNYRAFSAGLLPGVENIMGVRLPKLRELAKKLVRENWQDYVAWDEKQYFEEIMLHGMILGYAKIDFEQLLVYITEFVPQITNWSVCDSFCSGLKAFKKNQERGWEFLLPLAESVKEYEARFAFVMFLAYYVSEPYVDMLLRLAVNLKAQGYYAQMAAAWMVSKCYVNFSGKVVHILQEGCLTIFIHNKAISKICDSYAVAQEEKVVLKTLRR